MQFSQFVVLTELLPSFFSVGALDCGFQNSDSFDDCLDLNFLQELLLTLEEKPVFRSLFAAETSTALGQNSFDIELERTEEARIHPLILTDISCLICLLVQSFCNLACEHALHRSGWLIGEVILRVGDLCFD